MPLGGLDFGWTLDRRSLVIPTREAHKLAVFTCHTSSYFTFKHTTSFIRRFGSASERHFRQVSGHKLRGMMVKIYNHGDDEDVQW